MNNSKNFVSGGSVDNFGVADKQQGGKGIRKNTGAKGNAANNGGDSKAGKLKPSKPK